MSVLVDASTKLIVQGLTGHEGSFHAKRMIACGTKVVGGVTPGKGGTEEVGLPVFDTVEEAVRKTGATASVIFVPAPYAYDAILEASDSLQTVVCVTEGVPVKDMMIARRLVQQKNVSLVGPNCPGIVCPKARVNIGIMPESIFTPGPVGVVSRSGTLTYEIVNDLTLEGIGQSTCIGIGGDPIPGTTFIEALAAFESDDDTKAVIMIGEIGGDEEERAAEFAAENLSKPLVAYIAGFSAPPGKKMGHAGAIVLQGKGTAASKKAVLESKGIPVASTPVGIVKAVSSVLG